MKTGIVLLYGLYSPEREDYRKYLDFISGEIEKRNLERVILCGGFTNSKRPKESEASSARDYLLSVKPVFTNYILEEKSITTNQNLEFAARNLQEEDEVVVFCDLIRFAKVIWIAAHFLIRNSESEIYKALFKFAHEKNLYRDFQYKNLTVVGFDFPGKSKEEMIGQTFTTLLDVLALNDPERNLMDLEQRKRDFGLSS